LESYKQFQRRRRSFWVHSSLVVGPFQELNNGASFSASSPLEKIGSISPTLF
jgi:hypothetical protein